MGLEWKFPSITHIFIPLETETCGLSTLIAKITFVGNTVLSKEVSKQETMLAVRLFQNVSGTMRKVIAHHNEKTRCIARIEPWTDSAPEGTRLFFTVKTRTEKEVVVHALATKECSPLDVREIQGDLRNLAHTHNLPPELCIENARTEDEFKKLAFIKTAASTASAQKPAGSLQQGSPFQRGRQLEKGIRPDPQSEVTKFILREPIEAAYYFGRFIPDETSETARKKTEPIVVPPRDTEYVAVLERGVITRDDSEPYYRLINSDVPCTVISASKFYDLTKQNIVIPIP